MEIVALQDGRSQILNKEPMVWLREMSPLKKKKEKKKKVVT